MHLPIICSGRSEPVLLEHRCGMINHKSAQYAIINAGMCCWWSMGALLLLHIARSRRSHIYRNPLFTKCSARQHSVAESDVANCPEVREIDCTQWWHASLKKGTNIHSTSVETGEWLGTLPIRMYSCMDKVGVWTYSSCTFRWARFQTNWRTV